MMIKLKMVNDVELKTGTEELWAAVRKALGKNPLKEESDEEGAQMEDEDEEYATVSEEDISGEEGEEDAEMKDC